jgi:hypothetical protein
LANAILTFDPIKSKFVITLDGVKCFSRQKKNDVIEAYHTELLTSRAGKNMRLSTIPELEDHTGPEVATVSATQNSGEVVQSRFPINDRFNFLEQLGGMVLNKVVSSLIVTGEGGLGKTYSVMKLITDQGLEEDVDYIRITGFTTPKALYRMLYDYQDKIIIFDDCDSAFKDQASANILKAALDSSKTRRICWQSERVEKGEDGLPDSFEFTGQVFFISNVPLKKFSQPLRSRAYAVDLSMTFEDKLERMETIIESICPENDLMTKRDALDFIIENGSEMDDLNFRTLEKIIKIREGAGENWADLATYTSLEA